MPVRSPPSRRWRRRRMPDSIIPDAIIPAPPKRAARRVIVEWDDGSRHEFLRQESTHDWELLHTPPDVPEFQGEDRLPLRVTGYDRFQLTRVVVNCVDGDA